MKEIRINGVLRNGAWSELNQIWLRAIALEFALNYVQKTKPWCLIDLNTYNCAQFVLTEMKIFEACWRYVYIARSIYRLIDSLTEQWNCRTFKILLYNLDRTLSVTCLDYNIRYWMYPLFFLENAETTVKDSLKWSICDIIYRLHSSFHSRLYNPNGWMCLQIICVSR
jgi:hypothetical protein